MIEALHALPHPYQERAAAHSCFRLTVLKESSAVQYISRRTFLKSAGRATILGGFAATGLIGLKSLADDPSPACAASSDERPMIWVWKFSADGSLEAITHDLATHRFAITLKTNDGTEWMTRFDRTSTAVTGPHQIERLARHFEDAGIPFHTWFVAQGREPIWEARMANDVLNAGARSIYIDLEPGEGSNYWQGSSRDAMVFGEELRRLQPNAMITVAPDARPWQFGKVPIHEYISFSNRIAPQSYWETFNSPTNRRYLSERGYDISQGVTPELIVAVAQDTFAFSGLPVQPIGQGASSPDQWHRFITAAAGNGMNPVSLWRYGTADPYAFGVLRDMFPEAPPPVAAAPVQEQPAPAPADAVAAVAPTEQPPAASSSAPSAASSSGLSQRASQAQQGPCD